MTLEVGDHCETISIVTVSLDEALESEVTKKLPIGTTLNIIEVGHIPRRAKIRAGCVTGWINVKTRLNFALITKIPQSQSVSTGGQRESVGGLLGATDPSKIRGMLESARCGDLTAMQKIVEGNSGLMDKLYGRPNLNCCDIHGKTALMYATLFGNKNIVDYLLTKRHEVDVNFRDASQKTALHHALRRLRRIPADHTPIIMALIHAGASVEARDHKSCTPLMFAAARGREAAARVLLEAGACANAKDHRSHTPLDYAKNFGYYEVAALLKEFGAEGECNEACQSNIIYAANVSRVSSEQIQVCCINIAGELLDTWSFGSGATLIDLKNRTVKNKLVENKCQQMGIKHPVATFLLDDGTRVPMLERIADHECLTLKIG